VLLTYLGLGLGLLGFADALGQTRWVGRVAAVATIALGLLAAQEVLVPEWGTRLAVPDCMHYWLHRLTGRATLPAVFSAGVLVGLCTVPCSGAIYLAVSRLDAAGGAPGVADDARSG
jgi:cytochrome c biogenesis protein CcdA